MRVQLEVSNKTVDIEDTTNPYPTAQGKTMFLDILHIALDGVGITIKDITDYWAIKAAEQNNDVQ